MKKNMQQCRLAVKFVFLAAVFFSTGLSAAEFSINPLRVYLDGKQKSGTIVVENKSDEPLTIQATMNSWAQKNGKDDDIFPTNDLVVSPPIFKIQPKSRQVVRIGNLKKPDALLEGAYRLYLDEVPRPRKPTDTGVSVSIRSSLPIFIAPLSGKAKPDIKWKGEAVDDSSIKLSFSNSGNAHIQIIAIKVTLPDGSPLVEIPSMMSYLLPLQSHTFTFKTQKPWANEPLRVVIKSDAGAFGVETEVKPE
jgi:fimbrial chaperone protein